MEMSLKTVYEINAIPIITTYVFEVAKFFGATEKEANDLKLASEEAAEHIILNFPKAENSFFEIFCFFEKGLLKIVLSNTGLPVDKDNIPEYKVDNPNDTIDGLKFFLIKNLTDNFYFVNKGTGGWQTILEKGLCNPKSIEAKKDATSEEDIYIKNAKEPLEITMAKPEDAYELTKLAYFTYRYSYAKTAFYYPEVLKEAIANRTIMAFIAKNQKGEIVINSAYIRAPYCSEIVESGALMSHPAYRKNRSLLRLTKGQIQYAVDSKDFSVVEANFVTAHTNSQRIGRYFKFYPFAFKLSVHERVDFIGMEDFDPQRESLLYSVFFPNKIPNIKMYLEDCHTNCIKKLFENANIEIALPDNSAEFKEETIVNVETKKADNLASITLEQYGDDWLKVLKQTVRDLSSEGYISFHLKVPTWKPLPENLDNLLTSVNFFFSGVIARTPENWYMVYARLDNQKFSFENIKTVGDNTKELVDYVEKCYLKVLNN